MPIPWLRRIRESGQLTVFNKAGSWKTATDKALTMFNSLGFPVKLVATREERSANIVVVLAPGPTSLPHDEHTVKTRSDFDPERLHGQTSSLADGNPLTVFFAAVFLPGKIKGVTEGQKEVIIIHEFIHAIGLNGLSPDGSMDPRQDHEAAGIMFPQMQISGRGLLEYLPEEGARPMPPIRVGGHTRCKINMIWSADGCTDD